MCGIVGFFGKPSRDMYGVFEDLLQIDVIRGPHSTGIAAIHKKHVRILKDVVLPTDLLLYPEYKREIVANYECFGLIGHNRYATQGEIIQENAHPFKVGKITGVHNGTCMTWRYPRHLEKKTDSETLFNVINELGVDAMWQNLVGAASLVWWNAEEKTLNFLRNDERPMYWCYTDDEKGVFFASEAWMIRGAADRNKVKLKEAGKAWFPPRDKLFSFQYNNKNQSIDMSSRQVQPYVAPVVQRVPFHSQNTSQHGASSKRTSWTVQETSARMTSLTPLDNRSLPGTDNVFDLFKRTRAKMGKEKEPELVNPEVSLAEFQQKYGDCVFCQRALDPKTAKVVDEYNRCAICEACLMVAEGNGITIEGHIRGI